MKKEYILLIIVTLVIGCLLGVIFSKSQKDSVTVDQVAPSGPVVVDYQQNILKLVEVVGNEPDNRGAWVQLGANYYDSNQLMEANEAYDKALELNGNDPEVLTEQGIIYRRLGWLDKAINSFNKANQLDPNHSRSLLALGVVYIDVGNNERAKEVLNRFLELVPTGKFADQARSMLDHVESGQR